MIDPKQFRDEIIRPALKAMGDKYASEAAVRLLIGTAMVESHLKYLVQHGGGPALGLFQIEPATYHDVWENFLQAGSRKELRDVLQRMQTLEPVTPVERQLVHNLPYAAAMARLVYWRRPEPLPDHDDVVGLAKYWKDHYNTHLGAGKPEKFVALLRRAGV